MNPRMELLYKVILSPIHTEKAVSIAESQQKKVFKVRTDATKQQIKAALEKIFEVEVKAVNIINLPEKPKVFKGRRGTRNSYKKAVVTFKQAVNFESVFGG